VVDWRFGSLSQTTCEKPINEEAQDLKDATYTTIRLFLLRYTPGQIKDAQRQNCSSPYTCTGSWFLPADQEWSSKLGMTSMTKQSGVQSVSDIGSNEKTHLPKLPEPSSRAVGCSRRRKRFHPRRCSPSGQR
jgi:hypothetical protein